MPKVSVAIASFNHACFVRETLESVLSQGIKDLEVVVTDDGSHDGTPEVVASVSDPRIRLNAFPENRGASVAINDAISRCQGEYIAILNSDDYFLPGKLATQLRVFDAQPHLSAVFGMPRFIDEKGSPLGRGGHGFAGCFSHENHSRSGWIRRFFDEGNCLCHPTILVRAHCYHTTGLFDRRLRQLPDLDLWLRLAAQHDIHVLGEELTAFRVLRRERNVSAPSPQQAARHAWEMGQVLERYLELPEEFLWSAFKDAPEFQGRKDAYVSLALKAVATGRPGYVQFGLSVLSRKLKDSSDWAALREYFGLVGEIDPFGQRYNNPLVRAAASPAIVSMCRKIKRWLMA